MELIRGKRISNCLCFFKILNREMFYIDTDRVFLRTTLGNLVQGQLKTTVSRIIRAFMCGKASPPVDKLFVGDIFAFLFQ